MQNRMKIGGGKKSLSGAIFELERPGNRFRFFGGFAWLRDGGGRPGNFGTFVQFHDAYIRNFPTKSLKVPALLITFFKEDGLARVGSQIASSGQNNVPSAVCHHDAAA
jgi:hypothetical protein